MTIGFKEQDYIAGAVSRKWHGSVEDREDIKQNILEKMLKYPSPSHGYSWDTANSVYCDWIRKKLSKPEPVHLDFVSNQLEGGEDGIEARILLRELSLKYPKEMKFLYYYSQVIGEGRKIPKKFVLRAHRYRKKLLGEVQNVL